VLEEIEGRLKATICESLEGRLKATIVIFNHHWRAKEVGSWCPFFFLVFFFLNACVVNYFLHLLFPISPPSFYCR
jgi:hypothetical protein